MTLNLRIDRAIREYQRLVREELRLLARKTLADLEQLRLDEIHAALERCREVLQGSRLVADNGRR